MDKLSDNYYFRKCFLEKEQVPTQSVMKRTMSPPLAAVYFKSMSPNLKVLAGLAPPLKGGGKNTWYQPPQEVLNGRLVLKPIKKEHYNQLSCDGIITFSGKLDEFVNNERQDLKMKRLSENDNEWKLKIDKIIRQQWDECAQEAAENNTRQISDAFKVFDIVYRTSINKIDEMLMAAATKEMKKKQAEIYSKMNKTFKELLKEQATMVQDRYSEKFSKEKARLKAEFIQKVDESREDMSSQIHDLRVEKRVIIEKLRQLLESQNMACQVYMALKEREECAKEIQLSQHKHKKKVNVLKEQLALKDFEIRLEQEKEKKRLEFVQIWKKKICHVVKKFQMFVMFCLTALPEHADFFINMEKLMMLQLSEAVENPSAESIIQVEDEESYTPPVPRPHPFYLCCDKGYKPELDQDLCPKHCTSSSSQMPVVVVNKRCIYAACDNFNLFTDKIHQFLHGQRGHDADFTDNHEYEFDVPVKMTSSRQLFDLKLESSLLQVLQDELPNITNVPFECGTCKIPYCFCDSTQTSRTSFVPHHEIEKRKHSVSMQRMSRNMRREDELKHEREPKWESYMKFIRPTCKKHCSKSVNHHLEEHLPPYMRNMSKFDKLDIPNYETCDLGTLRRLVKKAQGIKTLPPVQSTPSRVRDVGTQYSDPEIDILCTCFSNSEVDKIMRELANCKLDASEEQIKVVGSAESASFLKERASSFAKECALTLIKAFDDSAELKEIFTKDCLYDVKDDA